MFLILLGLPAIFYIYIQIRINYYFFVIINFWGGVGLLLLLLLLLLYCCCYTAAILLLYCCYTAAILLLLAACCLLLAPASPLLLSCCPAVLLSCELSCCPAPNVLPDNSTHTGSHLMITQKIKSYNCFQIKYYYVLKLRNFFMFQRMLSPPPYVYCFLSLSILKC